MRFGSGKRTLKYLKIKGLQGPFRIFGCKFFQRTTNVVEDKKTVLPNYPVIAIRNILIRTRNWVNVMEEISGNSILEIAHQISKDPREYGPSLTSMLSSYNALGLFFLKEIRE